MSMGDKKMVKVFDPENGKPYTLAFLPGDEGDIKYTAGVRAYFECPTKRVFLCKKYQKKQCRLHTECNSIHACRKVVSELRAQSPEKWAQVMLKVVHGDMEFSAPLEQTEKTVGREALLASKCKKVAGVLCEAYDSLRCVEGEMCPRIHVTHNHMRHVRNMWQLPCCYSCVVEEQGDARKVEGFTPPHGVVVAGDSLPRWCTRTN
eukprot:Sspe_Gene.10745::Locus_3601_Transcript_1_1_Confidence_1.000_Length_773::g.10745::m.10745